MKVINPSFKILTEINGEEILKHIEHAGRIAYKSEDKITGNSSKKFVKMLIERGHLSVIEHVSVSVLLICDRGVTHEIVRHRIASYTQESTRYCNYSKGKFGAEITVIKPFFWDMNSEKFAIWLMAMKSAENTYMQLIEKDATPQEARSVLPNSLKTEIVITMNLREWRHFFKLRTAIDAHPQMREIVIPLLEEFRKRIPIVFDDINID